MRGGGPPEQNRPNRLLLRPHPSTNWPGATTPNEEPRARGASEVTHRGRARDQGGRHAERPLATKIDDGGAQKGLQITPEVMEQTFLQTPRIFL